MRHFGAAGVALGWLLVAPAMAYGEPRTEEAIPGVPPVQVRAVDLPLEAIEARGVRVGSILFRGRPIFDPDEPGERKAVFRMMDWLHMDTRPTAVESRLVLEEGQPFEAWRVRESERKIRQLDSLRDVWIRPVNLDVDTVDLLVSWREAWSLSPQADFDRVGDDSTFLIGLEEENLFGRAKVLGLEYVEDLDDRGFVLDYQDPNLFGSRWTLDVLASDTDDGHRRRLVLSEPFFSLDDRRAFFYEGESAEERTRIFEDGEEVRSWPTRLDRHRFAFGVSHGRHEKWTGRWYFGAGFQDERFFPDPEEGEVALSPPERRRYLYPFVLWELVEDHFVTLQQVDFISGEPEDFNLGWSVSAGVGMDLDGVALFSAGVGRGFDKPNDEGLYLFRTEVSGRVEEGFEDVFVGARFLYVEPRPSGNTFLLSFLAETLIEPDHDRQLLLGGRFLRGFPAREIGGDWRVSLSVEERWKWRKELFHFLWVRPAWFLDLGMGGPQGDGNVFGSAGVSFRIEPSRFSRGLVLSFNLGITFGGLDDADAYFADFSSSATRLGGRVRDRFTPHRLP